MKQMLKRTREITAYMLQRKGFFTKRLVVGTMTLAMMLFLDVKCHIWNGMGMTLLVLMTMFVVANYKARYMEMKEKDKELERGGGDDGSANPGIVTPDSNDGTEVEKGEAPDGSPSEDTSESIVR